MTDIGTGSYTIIRADRRRDDGRAISIRWWSSWAIPTSRSRRDRVANGVATTRPPASTPPASSCAESAAQKLGFNAVDAEFAEGQVRSGNRSAGLAVAARGW